jgi:hypothetical protein
VNNPCSSVLEKSRPISKHLTKKTPSHKPNKPKHQQQLS